MSGRGYSEEFKRRALERYQEMGLRPASRELGVDTNTLREL